MSAEDAVDLDSLFADVYPSLFRYSQRLTGDADAAHDLAQEAFVRLWRHEVSGEPAGLRVWLFKVVTHLARDRARVASKRLRLLERNPGDAPLPRAGPAPDVALEREQEVAAVREALGVLAPRDREILLLREEGFSYREIAEAIGVAPTSVGTLLARALRRFTEAYGTRHDRQAS